MRGNAHLKYQLVANTIQNERLRCPKNSKFHAKRKVNML